MSRAMLRRGFLIASVVLLFVCGVRAYAQPAAGSVTLVWRDGDPTVAGYDVYYGTASGVYTNVVDVGDSTNATITGLEVGPTYYFAVTAYNTNGVQSAYSSVVSTLIGSPVPTISTPTNQVVVAGGAPVAVQFTVGDSYTDASNLIVTASSDDPTVVAATNIVITGTGANRTATINSISQAGYADITLTVSYGEYSNSTTFDVTVLTSSGKPVPLPSGSYAGLFYGTTPEAVESGGAGAFTITVSSKGSYSGSLQMGSSHYSFSGKISPSGVCSNVITVHHGNPIHLLFNLAYGALPGQVSGTVSNGNWTATLIGDHSTFNARTNAAPYAGSYTLVFPGQLGSPAAPAGDGYGTLRVTPAGQVLFAAKLADGTTVSKSALVSSNGVWPLYIPLYGGHGLFTGWLDFTNEVGDDVAGAVTWIKPAEHTKYYPEGFTNELEAAGSIYQKPGRNQSVLDLTNAMVVFEGGSLTDFTNSVYLEPNDIVKTTNSLHLSFRASTGLFSGSVKDPTTEKSFPFGGAVFQKTQTGYGFLLDAGQSSFVGLGE